MRALPKGWAKSRLADVVEPIETTRPDRSPAENFRYVDIGCIDNETLKIADYKLFKGENAPSRARRVIRRNDVLFSTVRTYLRNIAMVPAELGGSLTSTGITVLRSNRAALPGYLFAFVSSSSFVESISKAQDGTMYPAVSDADVLDHEFPLPPLAEQKRIVEKLDSLTTASTEARTALTRVETLVEQYKQALPSAYFLKLDKRGTERKPFFEVLDYKGGTQPPKSEFQQEPGDNLIRLLQIRDFTSDDKAVYIPDSSKWSKCQSDDILIGRYGASIGRVLTGKSGAYNVALVKVLFDRSTFVPSFVRHWLMSSEFQNRLFALSRTAQNGFNKQDLADLTVPVPTMSSQKAATAEIDEALAQIETLANAAKSARERLDKLDRAVLTKAFRGELVPQDPNDEPASELLERLQKETA